MALKLSPQLPSLVSFTFWQQAPVPWSIIDACINRQIAGFPIILALISIGVDTDILSLSKGIVFLPMNVCVETSLI